MPRIAQINQYVTMHGLKDQFLAMFDQILSSPLLVQGDPWYIKSMFELTVLIREIAELAVRKNEIVKLSPMEREKEVDEEVLKIFWYFFSKQKSILSDKEVFVSQYKGFNNLKAISYLLKLSSEYHRPVQEASVKNHLNYMGINEWGQNFVETHTLGQELKTLKDELVKIEALKEHFNKALRATNEYRHKEKALRSDYAHLLEGILIKDDQLDAALATRVSKVAEQMDKPLSAVQRQYLCNILFFIGKHVGDKELNSNKALLELIENAVLSRDGMPKLLDFAMRVLAKKEHTYPAEALYNSLKAQKEAVDFQQKFSELKHQIKIDFDNQDGLTNKVDDVYEDSDEDSDDNDSKWIGQQKINLKMVHKDIRGLIHVSLGGDETISDFEKHLLTKLENTMGYRLVDLQREDYEKLEPMLLEAIHTQDASEVLVWLCQQYPKKIMQDREVKLSPTLFNALIHPSPKDLNHEEFIELMQVFLSSTEYTITDKTDFASAMSVCQRPNLSALRECIERLMISYSHNVSHPAMLRNYDLVDDKFKEKAIGLIFKIASFADVLQFDQLDENEKVRLDVAITASIRHAFKDESTKYDAVGEWSFKRYKKLMGFEDVAALPAEVETKLKAFFVELFGFDHQKARQLLACMTQAVSDPSQIDYVLQNKLMRIGGLSRLDSTKITNFMQIFKGPYRHQAIIQAADWLDGQYFSQVFRAHPAKIHYGFSDHAGVEHAYKRVNKLPVELQKFVLSYFKDSWDTKIDGAPDTDARMLVRMTELFFQRPIYNWSAQEISAVKQWVGEKEVNFNDWVNWVKETRSLYVLDVNVLDVSKLYDVAALAHQDVRHAVSQTLNWVAKAEQMEIYGDQKSPTLTYLAAMQEAQGISCEVIEQRLLQPLIIEVAKSPIVFGKFSEHKPTQGLPQYDKLHRLANESLTLLDSIYNRVGHEASCEVYASLQHKDYAAIDAGHSDFKIEPSVDPALKIAGANLLEAEELVERLGYASDFNQENIEDLSAYSVFWKNFLNPLKESGLLSVLEAENKAHMQSMHGDSSQGNNQMVEFSLREMKDAILRRKAALKERFKENSKRHLQMQEANVYSKQFSHSIHMMNLAFKAVKVDKDVEDIEINAPIEEVFTGTGRDRSLMHDIMSAVNQQEKIQDELANSIKCLRYVQRLSVLSSDDIRSIITSMDQVTLNKIKVKLCDLENTPYHNYTREELTRLAQSYLGTYLSFRNKMFSSTADIERLLKASPLKVDLSIVLDAMDVNGIKKLLGEYSPESQEKELIFNRLTQDKRDQLINAEGEEYVFTNVDLFDRPALDPNILVGKSLAYLSEFQPEHYSQVVSQAFYTKEVSYIHWVVESLFSKYIVNKNESDPGQQKGIALMLALSRNRDMFREALMQTWPKKLGKQGLNKLLAQFAPAWDMKNSATHEKHVLDFALSAQLLRHHGAAKLFNNNIEYHAPSQLANFVMGLTLLVFVTALLFWAFTAVVITGAAFVASLLMKVIVEHMKFMELKPYALSDQLGLVESVSQVETIWSHYNNDEVNVLMRMMEDGVIMNDVEPLRKYQIRERQAFLDDARIIALEDEKDIAHDEELPIYRRVINLLGKSSVILERKVMIRDIDPSCDVVLDEKQAARALILMKNKDDMLSLYKSEYPNVNESYLQSLHLFMFNAGKVSGKHQFSHVMEQFSDEDASTIYTSMLRISQIKTQIEDFTVNSKLPDNFNFSDVNGLSKQDAETLEASKIERIEDIQKLAISSDYSGKGLKCVQHNQHVRDLIVSHLKSSGDSVRISSRMQPMTMFGEIKIDNKLGNEENYSSPMTLSETV